MNLLAPNGKPSNLTQEQWFLVRTPEFKQWFGDWEKLELTKINDSGIDEITLKRLEDAVSKVVDENGEPLVVYHGSNNEFNKFSLEYSATNTGNSGFLGRGFYFSTNKRDAKNYGQIIKPYFLKSLKKLDLRNIEYKELAFLLPNLKMKNGKTWKDAFIEIDNIKSQIKSIEIEDLKNGFFNVHYEHNGNWGMIPKRTIHQIEADKGLGVIIDRLIEEDPNNIGTIGNYFNPITLSQQIKTQGFDLIMSNGTNIFDLGNEIVVFYPEQIKLADGTNTTFDGNNPDIRFEDGGEITLTINTIENQQVNRFLSRNTQHNGQFIAKNGKLFYITFDLRQNTCKVYNAELFVEAFKNGYFTGNEEVAVAVFSVDYENKTFSGFSENQSIQVKEDYRRIGIATAITDFVEDVLKMKYKPSKLLSKEMQGFVQNRFEKGGEIDNYNVVISDTIKQERFEFNNIIVPENEFYAWIFKNKVSDKNLSNENVFPKFTSALGDFWNKKNENLIGILKGRLSDNYKQLFILSMTTKPKFRKLGVMSTLIKSVRNQFNIDKDNITFVGLTKEGKEFLNKNKFKLGGRTVAQTPAPKKEQIYGSDINKKESSSSLENAKAIKFDEKTLHTITEKVKEHNKQHKNKKITLASAKAVVRRGMGAYSKSHRPTITGNKPNSRVAWGIARLNAFIYKIINGKSKSGKYKQDDDLIKELGIMVKNYGQGGDIPKANKMFHLPIELTVYVPSTKDVDKIITKREMNERVNEVKEYLGRTFGGFSASDVQGGFVASDGELVNEDIIKVVSFAQKDDYEKHKEQLVNKITEWAEKWGQEAIGLEYEGDLYYVPEKLKKGGSVSNNELKKESYWEGWGFSDSIKVLMKGEHKNLISAFKDIKIAFPQNDKEMIGNETIELFVDEKDLKRAKKIANANKLTLMYADGGEIDYSQGWNQDYENDPLVKAKRKVKETAIRAGMAYATSGASEVARAEGQAMQQAMSSMQNQQSPQGQSTTQSAFPEHEINPQLAQQMVAQNPQLIQMLTKSGGGFQGMARGGKLESEIDYALGGKKHNSDVNKAFEHLSDNNVSLKEMFKRGGVTPKQQNKIARVMREFKQGKLHSGSKQGPVVKDREQAIAIALSEAGVSNKK